MLPHELTEKERKKLLKDTFVMELRVLCNEDQLDDLNALMNDAARKSSVFVVHHTTDDPTDSDIEALEHPYDIDWIKL